MQGQISLGKKKLVRELHLSLVGVYKINIIPPMGEKVRIIPRQADVWQTKFLSIKISYRDFSIYILKSINKWSYRYVFTFTKQILIRMKAWPRCEWNHNGGTVLYFTHSFTNEKYEANNGNNTWINKLLTPTVKELSTPQANTFPFVNWAHIPIQIILLTRTYFNCNSCLW